MKKLTYVLVALFLVLLLTPMALAQTTANITGTVTDTTGAIVVDAKVTLKSAAHGIDMSTQTNSDGLYQFAGLLPGTYTVDVHKNGFQTQIAKDLVLVVGTNSLQNFSLKVVSSSETVTVEANSTAQVESTTITVGQ